MSSVISECKKYRYELSRELGSGKGRVLFILLNPSTADSFKDDPTIRRLKGFTERLGFKELKVVNLFAFRTANPQELKKCSDPHGKENTAYIVSNAKQADFIICAWGAYGSFLNKDEEISNLLMRYDIYSLGTTKNGHPRHPLYIPYEKKPILYRRKLISEK